MADRRIKPCAQCGHPKSRHRTRECRYTWQAKGRTFMGIGVITKWCPCDGYRFPETAPSLSKTQSQGKR